MKIDMKRAIRPVTTKKQYAYVLGLIDRLMDAKPGSRDEEILGVLSILAENYERQHFPIAPPDAAEAIRFRLEQMGKDQNYLGMLIGRNRASEILSKKRPLSIGVMRTIQKELKIPAEILLHG